MKTKKFILNLGMIISIILLVLSMPAAISANVSHTILSKLQQFELFGGFGIGATCTGIILLNFEKVKSIAGKILAWVMLTDGAALLLCLVLSCV